VYRSEKKLNGEEQKGRRPDRKKHSRKKYSRKNRYPDGSRQ
jgi:hypothetical protein